MQCKCQLRFRLSCYLFWQCANSIFEHTIQSWRNKQVSFFIVLFYMQRLVCSVFEISFRYVPFQDRNLTLPESLKRLKLCGTKSALSAKTLGSSASSYVCPNVVMWLRGHALSPTQMNQSFTTWAAQLSGSILFHCWKIGTWLAVGVKIEYVA